MKVKKSTFAHCRAISAALQAKSDQTLIHVIEQIGFEALIDPELMTLLRASSSNAGVILLSTLWIENGIEPQKSKQILAAYNSIIKKSLDPQIEKLGGRNPIHYVVRELIKAKSEIKPFRDKVRITPDLLLAIEIAIDFKAPQLALHLIKAFVSSSPTLIEIQTIINSLALRNDLQPDFASWGEIADCWIELMNKFESSKDEHAKQHVKMFIANALGSAKRVEDCISYCDQINDKEFIVTSLLIAVKSLSIDHQYARAIEKLKLMADQLLSPHLTEEKQEELELPVEPVNKNSDKDFNVDGARHALQDLYTILAPLGVKPFLMSGTLLGFARNNDFMLHDKDIDVGIFADVDKLLLSEALFKSGKFIFNFSDLVRDPLYTMPVTHIEKGICIDLFFYHDHGESFVTAIDYDWNFISAYSYSKFSIVKADFAGMEVYIPDAFETCLEENFGPHWRIPDKHYLSHLEAPARLHKGDDVFALIVWIYMTKLLRTKEYDKLKRLAEVSHCYASPLSPSADYFEMILKRLTAPKIDKDLVNDRQHLSADQFAA